MPKTAFTRHRLFLLAAGAALLLSAPAHARRAGARHHERKSPAPHSSATAVSGAAASAAAAATEKARADFSTVIIDAGHGGHDLGGILENLIPEKGVALDVAQRLQRILESAGVHTVMTRSDDTFITLGERVRIANAQSDAIFVSVHFNATQRADARGIESYYGSAASAPLARLINRNLLTVSINPESRPVRHATYWVLRETKIRAVLAECGFLTNPEDTAAALQQDYRQKLAAQIAAAILEYRQSLNAAPDEPPPADVNSTPPPSSNVP